MLSWDKKDKKDKPKKTEASSIKVLEQTYYSMPMRKPAAIWEYFLLIYRQLFRIPIDLFEIWPPLISIHLFS